MESQICLKGTVILSLMLKIRIVILISLIITEIKNIEGRTRNGI